MGETPVGSAHYHALFFAGLILFFMTLAINKLSAADRIERRGDPFMNRRRAVNGFT
jgi:phosphate transport system permease protein